MYFYFQDNRLGGYLQPIVGVGTIDLTDKIPWSKTYRAPQTDSFFANPLDKAAGFVVEKGDLSIAGDNSTKAKKDFIKPQVGAIKEKRLNQKDEDDFVLTQEPLSVEQFIKGRLAAEDSGAGVFGALTHLPLPEYGGKARKKAMNVFFAEVNFDEEEEVQPPKYMKNRIEHKTELEDIMKTTPFETYNLTRGQVNGMFGSTLKVVGKFKGLIRVMQSPDEPSLIDLSSLLKPSGYKIRLYVLNASNLTAMDMGFMGKPGRSDPYLRVKLGKNLFDDRVNAIDDVVDADMYKVIEMNAELPGTSQLQIEVMDKDDIGSDDLIGKTVIDLEDRWFDGRWQKLGSENRVTATDDPNGVRWDTKPIEVRSLYCSTSNNAQGQLRCWLDILTPAEAQVFPPDDVALPPRQIFEMRVVIWKCKEVPAQDLLGGQNMTDMYVQVRPEGCTEQQTDTHWRAKKGKGSFNWRMLFDVELGHNTRAMKFPYLSLQIWDRDLLKYNDCICESTFNMKKYYEKAYRKNVAVKLFETKKGAAAQRAREAKARSKIYDIPETEEDIPDDEEGISGETNPMLQKIGNSSGLTSPVAGLTGKKTNDNYHEMVDSDDEDDRVGGSKDTGVGLLGFKPKVYFLSLIAQCATCFCNLQFFYMNFIFFQDSAASAADEAKRRQEEEEKKKVEDAKKKRAAGTKNDSNAPTANPVDEEVQDVDGQTELEQAQEAEDQDTTDFVNSVKEMTGLWDIDPPDSMWLAMDRLNHETGVRDPMGQLCFRYTTNVIHVYISL